jgi:ureidoglycolate hydrolase
VQSLQAFLNRGLQKLNFHLGVYQSSLRETTQRLRLEVQQGIQSRLREYHRQKDLVDTDISKVDECMVHAWNGHAMLTHRDLFVVIIRC